MAGAAESDARAVRTLVILGATGDLAGRLLLPGLASLVARDRAPGLTLVGVGTRDWSDRRWQDRVRDSFAEADDESDEAGRAALDDMRKHTSYRKVDVTAPGELARLVKSVEAPVALYFALPPAVTERACELLTAADLPEGTDWRSHHDARQFY